MKQNVDIPDKCSDRDTLTSTASSLSDDDIAAKKQSLEIIVHPLDPELLTKVEAFCEDHNSSMFVALLATFKVLQQRYNNEGSILAKNVTANESGADDFRLSTQANGDMVFTDLLRETDTAKTAYATAGGEILLHKMFVLYQKQDMPLYEEEETVSILGEKIEPSLIFIVSDCWKPEIIVKYSKHLYSPEEIHLMIDHFQRLLNSAMAMPDQKIGSLPMLTPKEEHDLLEVFNNTSGPCPAEKTIVDLFQDQVAKTPDNIALYMGDSSVTYNELNKKANRLAHYLIANGVKQEDNIGVVADRGFDMIVCLLAILKAGAAYVPAEPGYPTERKQYIFSNSAVSFVLSDYDVPPGDQYTGCRVANLHTIDYDGFGDNDPGLNINSGQLAYTIYTSGSTGVPKGVMIEHHSVVNLITWVNSEFSVGEEDSLLFITSACFDLSVYDIFGMLTSGGSVVIATREDVINTPRLIEMLKTFRITIWDSVPSTMDHLVRQLSVLDDYRHTSMRLVLLSGDWIPVHLPKKIEKYFINSLVVSLGGATEGTVWSNFFPLWDIRNDWRSIPYGKPILNTQFYILNDQLQPVPQGVIGELFIGGKGVARGYSNDPEKTKRSFLPDPFTQTPGGKVYRTGDLGRMLPNMNIEFIGRKDSQIKIRGFRVELGEIESVIEECKSVVKSIVIHDGDKGQLIAFIEPGQYYQRETVVDYLKTKVPDYMIPTKWVEVDKIPLTENGKTNKKALITISEEDHAKNNFAPAETDLEIALAQAWIEVLGLDKISIHDNFFDLGGQSLVAVELVAEMEKKTGRSLHANILYKYPTVAKLADFLLQESGEKKWKHLLPIKPFGQKTPLYIVHGDGLSLSDFHNLGQYVDEDQPVYSLKPIGLADAEVPPDNIPDIARCYVSEILEQNPDGPYALAGYSFGGYVSIEMKKQLQEKGKTVKMVAIFDTDAQNVVYKKDWVTSLPKRLKRQIPKFLFITKSIFTAPVASIKYQYMLLTKKIASFCYTIGLKEKPHLNGISLQLDRINETHIKAFKNYHLSPFHDKIHLFKAKKRVYYVDDFECLGWANYALNGVSVYEVPGDHKTMFESPNVHELARMLQFSLDHC